MITIESIQELGLTTNEAKVYKALLELGPSLAGGISRRTGLHRRTVYDTTEMLIKKGLIGYILKNNRRLFQASNPEKFLDILKEKENSVSKMLPDMLNLFQSTREKEETNFYKGKQGLKTVFEEQLKEKEILILGANRSFEEVLPFYFNWYDLERKKKKIKVKIIASEKISNIPLSEIRYLPQKYSNPLAINIYGDKTALILWKKDNPIAIVIRDKAISDSYRKYFELTWRVASSG
jgi:sugar-specific transcriptional regulator TrmB